MVGSGSDDKEIKLWDLNSGRCIRTFKEHKDSVYCVTFSPDGTMIASASDDSSIKIWNIS